MKCVLVTGITGLIGKELVEPLIKNGFEIHAITLGDEIVDSRVTYHHANLFDTMAIRKVCEEVKANYLMNLAWIVTGDYNTSNLNFDFLSAGINLLHSFKDNGGEHVLFAGTCFEYAPQNKKIVETDPIDESSSTYVFCKNELHKIASKFCLDNDLTFAFPRIFYTYGRNESVKRLTGMIIDHLKKNESLEIKTSSLIKDYMYSKDIARALVHVLKNKFSGDINICTGLEVTVKDFALAIANEMNRPELLIFKDIKTSQPPKLVGDNSKLLSLGFKYQYDLKAGVKDMLELV